MGGIYTYVRRFAAGSFVTHAWADVITHVVFASRRNYGNTKFPTRKYCPVTSNVGNPIRKFGVLQSTSKVGKWRHQLEKQSYW